jgi:hypothetical protein
MVQCLWNRQQDGQDQTKMRLPGIKISSFAALLLPYKVVARLVLYTNH